MRTPWHLRKATAAIQSLTENTVTRAKSYSTVTGLSAVPCTIQPDTSTDSLRDMREQGLRRSTCALPLTYGGVAVTVKKDYRIVSGGITYRVVGAGMNRAAQDANQTVTVEEDS